MANLGVFISNWPICKTIFSSESILPIGIKLCSNNVNEVLSNIYSFHFDWVKNMAAIGNSKSDKNPTKLVGLKKKADFTIISLKCNLFLL
jgi:hypothetical protein